MKTWHNDESKNLLPAYGTNKRIRMPVVLLPALLVLAGCITPSPAPLTQPAPEPIPSIMNTQTPQPSATVAPVAMDIFTRNFRLGRGVNLGNALEAPAEGEWGVVLEENDFQLIKDAGFTAVRIPTRWSAHASLTAPYTIEPAFMQRVAWAVNQALSRGLAVVLNVHHYDELIQSLDSHTPRFLSMWQQIAQHFEGYSPDLCFELLNEPHDIGAEAWNDLLAKTLAVVRATNPTRCIVIGPVDWNSHRRLNDLKLPADDQNLIVTFHYYLPFEFTHQGAEWVNGSNQWLGTTWQGTRAQQDNLTFDLDVAAQWGQQNQRPVFLGEFGAYSKADMDSRSRWTAFVAREAEARKMSWAYWEFRSGFGVYNNSAHQWNEALRQALIPNP